MGQLTWAEDSSSWPQQPAELLGAGASRLKASTKAALKLKQLVVPLCSVQ